MRNQTNPYPEARPPTVQPATAQRDDVEVAPPNRASVACCALLRPMPTPAAQPQTTELGVVATRHRGDGR